MVSVGDRWLRNHLASAPAEVAVPTFLVSGAGEDADRDSLLIAGALALALAAELDGEPLGPPA